MAGLALALELLSKGCNAAASHPNSLHSFASLTAVSAATAASSIVTFLPSFLGSNAARIVHCDSATDSRWGPEQSAWSPYSSITDEDIEDAERWEPTWHSDVLTAYGHPNKSYHIELKPFFSAFGIRALLGTTLRALILSFQPVLEERLQHLKPEEDDELEEDESASAPPLEFTAPLKNAGKHIIREVTVNSTRRGLERVIVCYASKRMAWKLLKDLSKSAKRKAERHISGFQLFVQVTKTTFRGYLVGVAANWLVQHVLDIYRFFHNLHYQNVKESKVATNNKQRITETEMRKLGRKVTGSTLKCGASLVFASIGAGVGSVFIRPSTGQWLGAIAGDYAGAFLMGYWIDEWIVFGASGPPQDEK